MLTERVGLRVIVYASQNKLRIFSYIKLL